MAIALTCPCGISYRLKEELAGTQVQCPTCKATLHVPGGRPAGDPPPGVDPVFHRNTFYIRQKLFSLDERYAIWDEAGAEILYIVRPSRILATLGAVLVAVAMGCSVLYGAWQLTYSYEAQTVPLLLTALAVAFAAFLFSMWTLLPKKHVRIFRDKEGGELLLEVLQDQRMAPIEPTFTVRLPDGREIAHLKKNVIYDLIRSRWEVFRPDGALWAVALEDSLLLAVLRRLAGHLYGVLRKHFVIFKAGDERPLGQFTRQFTLLDRYMLDMHEDGDCVMDRRVALALGVMLDSGEGR